MLKFKFSITVNPVNNGIRIVKINCPFLKGVRRYLQVIFYSNIAVMIKPTVGQRLPLFTGFTASLTV